LGGAKERLLSEAEYLELPRYHPEVRGRAERESRRRRRRQRPTARLRPTCVEGGRTDSETRSRVVGLLECGLADRPNSQVVPKADSSQHAAMATRSSGVGGRPGCLPYTVRVYARQAPQAVSGSARVPGGRQICPGSVG
jgi:hypothetical protein